MSSGASSTGHQKGTIMKKRILVAVDGSAGAAAAAAWSAGAAESWGAEVVVVGVVDPTKSREGAFDNEKQRISDGLDSDWSSPFADIESVTTRLEEGDPREMIQRVVDDEGIAIVVVGSTGTEWFPAVHLGHVGHHLASHARVATVVVPPQARRDPLDVIVVGIDGSKGSKAAVALAGSLVTRSEQVVVGVHVHLPMARAGHPVEDGDWRTALQQQSEEWLEMLRGNGVRCEVVVQEGHPAQVLSAVARAHHAGAIVVGARGHGTVSDVQLGTVALRLLQTGEHTVIVVPLAD